MEGTRWKGRTARLQKLWGIGYEARGQTTGEGGGPHYTMGREAPAGERDLREREMMGDGVRDSEGGRGRSKGWNGGQARGSVKRERSHFTMERNHFPAE